jgi:hypothetical protein
VSRTISRFALPGLPRGERGQRIGGHDRARRGEVSVGVDERAPENPDDVRRRPDHAQPGRQRALPVRSDERSARRAIALAPRADVGEGVGERVHELQDGVAAARVRRVDDDRTLPEVDVRDRVRRVVVRATTTRVEGSASRATPTRRLIG